MPDQDKLPKPVSRFSNWMALFALLISAGLGVERVIDIAFFENDRHQTALRGELREVVQRLTEMDLLTTEITSTHNATDAQTRVGLLVAEKLSLIDRGLEVIEELDGSPSAPMAYMISSQAKLFGYENEAVELSRIAIEGAKTEGFRADATAAYAQILILPGPHQDQNEARVLFADAISMQRNAEVLAPQTSPFVNTYLQWIGWEVIHGDCNIAREAALQAYKELIDDPYAETKISNLRTRATEISTNHPRCSRLVTF